MGITTKASFGPQTQNETAVALPTMPSAGEPGVKYSFFGYTEKTTQVGKASMGSVPMNGISRQHTPAIDGSF